MCRECLTNLFKGYLSALAYIRLFRADIGDEQIAEVLEDILLAGLTEGKLHEGTVILSWSWHKKVSKIA